MGTKEQISVKIPCGMNVSASLTMFAVNLYAIGQRPECPYAFNLEIIQNYKPVDYARNVMVKHFLASRDTRLWMIDSDIAPSVDSYKILGTDGDIVSGKYDIWGSPDAGGEIHCAPTSYVWEPSKAMWRTVFVPEGVNMKADAAGTGFMVIKRHVLEDKRMWLSEDGSDYTPLFRNIYGPSGRIRISEDMDFCQRARNLGYSLVINGSIHVGHLKTVSVKDIVDHGARCFDRGAEHGRTSLVSASAS